MGMSKMKRVFCTRFKLIDGANIQINYENKAIFAKNVLSLQQAITENI